MGGGASSPKKKGPKTYKLSDMDQRKLCWAMPPWCIDKFVVNDSLIEAANNSWKYAMSGEAPPYLVAKAKEPSLTPLVFFYNQFYYFLFELLPDTKKLFKKGMKAQGRMLANVIKYIITSLRESDETILRHSLEHLARVHNSRGIVADQYSVMGMCLVHTIRICTGPDYWNSEIHDAWVNIYSKMMSIIIPVVISGDLDDQTEMDTASLKKVEYYKEGNLNADGDQVRATGKTPPQSKGCPMIPTLSKPPSTTVVGSGCPVMNKLNKEEQKEETELSVTLDRHLSTTAAAHVKELGREAELAASKQKYSILNRVIELSSTVESLLQNSEPMPDPGMEGGRLPRGMITGSQLLKLMMDKNLVADKTGAKVAAGYFVQMQLMSPVNLYNQSLNCAATIGSFAAEHVYSFTAQTLQPLSGGKNEASHSSAHGNTPEPSKSRSSKEFKPRCLLPTAGLVPFDGVLNALSPSPALEDQPENQTPALTPQQTPQQTPQHTSQHTSQPAPDANATAPQ